MVNIFFVLVKSANNVNKKPIFNYIESDKKSNEILNKSTIIS